MLKYLPDRYIEKILRREPDDISAADRRTADDRLAAFDLQTLEDNNSVTELPIPADFGSLDKELQQSYIPYQTGWERIERLVSADPPPFPKSWDCPKGWSYWDKDRWTPIALPPRDRCFVLDAETVEIEKGSGIWHPTCMVAMSERGWMAWRADFDKIDTVAVVPFSDSNHILGYNVSYDRSYLDIEYNYADSGNRFYDLLSMWVVTNGMSNQQRTVYKKFETSDEEGLEETVDFDKPVWLQKTGTNGLASAYKHYTGKSLDKGVRDGIVDLGRGWVVENMPEVLRYCALDVLATHTLAGHLLPAYKRHRPHEVNRNALVALGSCWVPLSGERFPGFYARLETLYQTDKAELNDLLLEACTEYLNRVRDDIPEQALCMDWTPAASGKNKGLPQWYRDVLSKYRAYKSHIAKYGASKGGLSLSQRFAPIVLEMRWNGEILKWDTWAKGWYTGKHGLIPHPTTRGQAVGNMFLKDFAGLYESGFITVPDYVRALVEKRVAAINWVSIRKRVKSIRTQSPDGSPVAIPQMVVNGTVTGRATDAIWQVAANPKKTRYGTELKSMVAPYPGFSFVGADVNSQEAWLAACHGDEDLGFNASTPFSAIVVLGNSTNKTDIHSVMLRGTPFDRDQTKPRVYGGLYGQGVKGDKDLVLKADPSLSDEEATEMSVAFMERFKGKKVWSDDGRSKAYYKNGLASQAFTRMEELADLKQPRTPLTGAYMSGALAGVKDYKPTRVNWIVQSSGVDFRDMLVLLTEHFYRKLGVDGRLVLTIHDEIRTMVRNEDVTKATYALQLAHLYVRAAFIRAHKLDNLPAGIAWFSEVDVDSVCLRKDPNDPQVTPTQTALPLGYTLNPQQLLELL